LLRSWHVVKLAGEAADQVRRAEWNARGKSRTKGGKWVKGTRWSLLKALERRSVDQLAILGEVQRPNRPLYRAFPLKEELRIYQLDDPAEAPELLRACSPGRVARRSSCSPSSPARSASTAKVSSPQSGWGSPTSVLHTACPGGYGGDVLGGEVWLVVGGAGDGFGARAPVAALTVRRATLAGVVEVGARPLIRRPMMCPPARIANEPGLVAAPTNVSCGDDRDRMSASAKLLSKGAGVCVGPSDVEWIVRAHQDPPGGRPGVGAGRIDHRRSRRRRGGRRHSGRSCASTWVGAQQAHVVRRPAACWLPSTRSITTSAARLSSSVVPATKSKLSPRAITELAEARMGGTTPGKRPSLPRPCEHSQSSLKQSIATAWVRSERCDWGRVKPTHPVTSGRMRSQYRDVVAAASTS
jgi:hypothetical protein